MTSQERDRDRRNRDAIRAYQERLEAYQNGTLPMPPEKPVRSNP